MPTSRDGWSATSLCDVIAGVRTCFYVALYLQVCYVLYNLIKIKIDITFVDKSSERYKNNILKIEHVSISNNSIFLIRILFLFQVCTQ